jgi:predicted secreted Zn-dependent protease
MGRSSLSTIATKAAIFALGLGFAPAQSEPLIIVQTKTYPVSATTSAGLQAEMRKRGPRGFWAYTRWDIRWSKDCVVDVQITYTLPRHSNPGDLPVPIARSWRSMRAALKAHEEEHGSHGIAAAREISQANCVEAKSIIRKYNLADLRLDRLTRHGQTQGVRLD